MKIRPGKHDDQKNIDKAVDLINELMDSNPGIEETLWSAAMISTVFQGYHNSGCTKKELKEEIFQMHDHYEKFFKE